VEPSPAHVVHTSAMLRTKVLIPLYVYLLLRCCSFLSFKFLIWAVVGREGASALPLQLRKKEEFRPTSLNWNTINFKYLMLEISYQI
jgi:hypothetical protein